MKYAARINSFHANGSHSLENALRRISEVPGITHVDLNYPEHFEGLSTAQVKELLKRYGLLLNGVASRFSGQFAKGEFTNPDTALAAKCVELCLEGIEACRSLGGEIITVWQAYDGFDYSFQVPYAKGWESMREAFVKIADAAGPDLRVSIEYKPFQPRPFSLIPNVFSTLLMIEDVGRSNVGVTLDFCHMLMADENPALGVDLAASRGKLFGIHLNDGNGLNDDGLMVGSVHPVQTLEFLYYTLKNGYDEVIYFDTFPVRESATEEAAQNFCVVECMFDAIKRVGLKEIEKTVNEQDGLEAVKLAMRMTGLSV